MRIQRKYSQANCLGKVQKSIIGEYVWRAQTGDDDIERLCRGPEASNMEPPFKIRL